MTRVLALDIGTSSVRALVYDADGEAVLGAEARTRYATTSGQVDSDELVAACAAALDEARREAGGVDAVAASCFMHSLLALDSRDRPLTPLLTWLDTRPTDDAEELRRELDPDAVHARTGCPIHASFWPAKLRRLRRDRPDVFRSAARFVSFADYLYLRLVGDAATSRSLASATGLLGLGGEWDPELLAALDVEPERLPSLSEAAAGEEEPWFRALADGPCSNVGAGATGRERAALTIGTSAAFRLVFDAVGAPAPRPGLFLYLFGEDRLVEGGALSDGGNLWEWLEQTLEAIDERALADAPPDAHGLTFLPLLGGERSPGWHPRAHGAVLGLTFGTGPQQLAQAALEGVAFRLAEIADLLPEARDVVAAGGALHASPAWTQILADVLERPLALSAVAEASARGAAVLALEHLGERPAPAPVARRFEPRGDRVEAYREARARQRALYEFVTEEFEFLRH